MGRVGSLATVLFKCVILLSPFITMNSAHAWYFWTPGDTVDNGTDSFPYIGYKPDQPIPFSHKLHAGKRQIPCQYCHSSARRSSTAGIPSSNTCMGCHKIVKTDSPHIKYLTDKYQKNEPIEWVKVHDLPDFVHFPHKRHVAAGLACQECHGQVQEMDQVQQVAPLQMGWCIGCHTKKKAPLDCVACHY